VSTKGAPSTSWRAPSTDIPFCRGQPSLWTNTSSSSGGRPARAVASTSRARQPVTTTARFTPVSASRQSTRTTTGIPRTGIAGFGCAPPALAHAAAGRLRAGELHVVLPPVGRASPRASEREATCARIQRYRPQPEHGACRRGGGDQPRQDGSFAGVDCGRFAPSARIRDDDPPRARGSVGFGARSQ
jgi:hypothetical protein